MSYDPFSRSAAQDAVLEQIGHHCATGSVLLVDVDGCLTDTRAREAMIAREFAEHTGHYGFAALAPEDFVRGDLVGTLVRAGLDPALAPAFRAFWADRFFSDDHCALDRPMPGAKRLLDEAVGRGAIVVYLTGRTRNMRVASLASFRRFGFPVDGARFLDKVDPSVGDRDHKASVLEQALSIGPIAAALDNEPENVALFRDRLPGSLVVFVHTDFGSGPPPVDLPTIRGFLRTTDQSPPPRG